MSVAQPGGIAPGTASHHVIAQLAAGGFLLLAGALFAAPFLLDPRAGGNDVFGTNQVLAPLISLLGSVLYVLALRRLGPRGGAHADAAGRPCGRADELAVAAANPQPGCCSGHRGTRLAPGDPASGRGAALPHWHPGDGETQAVDLLKVGRPPCGSGVRCARSDLLLLWRPLSRLRRNLVELATVPERSRTARHGLDGCSALSALLALEPRAGDPSSGLGVAPATQWTTRALALPTSRRFDTVGELATKRRGQQRARCVS